MKLCTSLERQWAESGHPKPLKSKFGFQIPIHNDHNTCNQDTHRVCVWDGSIWAAGHKALTGATWSNILNSEYLHTHTRAHKYDFQLLIRWAEQAVCSIYNSFWTISTSLFTCYLTDPQSHLRPCLDMTVQLGALSSVRKKHNVHPTNNKAL